MYEALPEIAAMAAGMTAATSILWFTLKTGISPMPSSLLARSAIIEAGGMVESEMGEGAIIECGSGWGGLLLALARRYPERRVIGYELSWLPWAWSRLVLKLSGLKHVEIYRRDFLKTELPQAALMVCYLYPGGMEALAAKLAAEPQPGCLLISNTFALPGHVPLHHTQLDDLHRTTIDSYRL